MYGEREGEARRELKHEDHPGDQELQLKITTRKD